MVESAGVERGVMNAADGEGDCVGRCRSFVVSTAHKVLGEGHMCVEVEVKSSTPAPAVNVLATSPASEYRGVGDSGATVISRHCIGDSKLYVEGYFFVFA